VKIFNAIGRLIGNPLLAIVVCAGGAYAIWFGLPQPPGGSPKANLTGKERSGQRTTKDGRSDQFERGSFAAAETVAAQKSIHAPGETAGRARAKTKKTNGRGQVVFEEFEAENEPLASSAEPTVADRQEKRPDVTSRESTTASTSDTIGPRDPRAKAMLEYPAKKAAVGDDAIAQQGLAVWCDQNGLWERAKAHWEAVRRLDPKSDAAQNRLGLRWRGGTWVSDAARAEDVAQTKANSYWEYNDSIRALNERVARVLNDACNAGIKPDPEAGRRWLALALGTEYQPAADRPKRTFTEIVSPLYSPTFLPIPVAT